MKKFLAILCTTIGLIVFVQFSTAQAVLYSLDDGSAEIHIGTSALSDYMWLNSYTVQPGGELITSISLTWGASGMAGGNNSGGIGGEPVTVMLYNDPNNDGNPVDAILLATANTSVANIDLDIFSVVPIIPTQVSGMFFVAALLPSPGYSTFLASLDETDPDFPGRSWIVASNPGAFDINNLGANVLVSLDTIEFYGYSGNWLLRANGEPDSIPEPSTMLLLGLGLVGLAFARRRKR